MENRRNERKICAIDAEGDAGNTGLLGVAFFDGEIGQYLRNPDDISDLLYDYARQGYDFVAHNAQYDLVVIFWQLDIDAQAVFYNQRFNHGRWFYDKEKPAARIWDTLSISAFLSLAKIGAAIGIPKLPTPNHLLGEGDTSEPWTCDRHSIFQCEECYAIRDAEICWHYYDQYKNTLNSFSVAPKHTLGSAAVAIWHKTDPGKADYIKSKELADFIRGAYYGGRTEPFKYGHVPKVYTADVQSMYPSIMLEYPMPDTRYLQWINNSHSLDGIIEYEGVSECTVLSPPAYIPILPIRLNNKLLFPIGTFRGSWTHCELRALVANGGEILEFHRTVICTELTRPFDNFITKLVEMRQSLKSLGDPRELVAKILANSLYGRMGLRSEQEQSIYIRWNGRKPLDEYVGYDIDIQPNGIFLTQSIERNQVSHDANILWAAYITSLARLKLYSYLVQQGKSLVYCDTDSIYSLDPIVGTSPGFGNLNVEDTFDSGYFKGPKLYRLESKDGSNKVKARGVPAKYANTFIDTGYAEFHQPLTVKESLVRKKNAGEWVLMHRTQQMTFAKRQLINPSAVFTDDSYSDTFPLIIGLDGDIFGEW